MEPREFSPAESDEHRAQEPTPDSSDGENTGDYPNLSQPPIDQTIMEVAKGMEIKPNLEALPEAMRRELAEATKADWDSRSVLDQTDPNDQEARQQALLDQRDKRARLEFLIKCRDVPSSPARDQLRDRYLQASQRHQESVDLAKKSRAEFDSAQERRERALAGENGIAWEKADEKDFNELSDSHKKIVAGAYLALDDFRAVIRECNQINKRVRERREQIAWDREWLPDELARPSSYRNPPEEI